MHSSISKHLASRNPILAKESVEPTRPAAQNFPHQAQCRNAFRIRPSARHPRSRPVHFKNKRVERATKPSFSTEASWSNYDSKSYVTLFTDCFVSPCKSTLRSPGNGALAFGHGPSLVGKAWASPRARSRDDSGGLRRNLLEGLGLRILQHAICTATRGLSDSDFGLLVDVEVHCCTNHTDARHSFEGHSRPRARHCGHPKLQSKARSTRMGSCRPLLDITSKVLEGSKLARLSRSTQHGMIHWPNMMKSDETSQKRSPNITELNKLILLVRVCSKQTVRYEKSRQAGPYFCVENHRNPWSIYPPNFRTKSYNKFCPLTENAKIILILPVFSYDPRLCVQYSEI